MTLFLIVYCTMPAAAQERGRAGLTMWYPVGFGVVFGLLDRIALRPDIGITRSVSDGVTEGTLSSWGLGLSALFYLQKTESLSTYVSPRVAFCRSTVRWSGYHPGERLIDSSQASGSLGVQYALVRRFSVFGEVGLAYTDLHLTESNSTYFRKAQTWELRTIVGVILLF